MKKKHLITLLVIYLTFNGLTSFAKSLLPVKDPRARELKYQYSVLKDDEKNKMEKKILDLFPSGYMTVEEYESLSEYKDKANIEIEIPKISTPSDFKYVPKPLYRIVKYNDPPGSVELTIDKKIYKNRQLNAQGIVAPDFSMLVYPAIYYYTDSASVACDLFIIPLTGDDTNLNKILKANVLKKNPTPILSTDNTIDNYAVFRTLTPVDFSQDGTKLLVKQKRGSREDGIWETSIYVYDFRNKVSYNLSEIRDAVVYFWKEYMDLNLDDKRWDIYPIGFAKDEPDRIIIQAFAFTGEKPVFLGNWSIDWQGNQSRLISFDKKTELKVSINGYKVVQDGIMDYQSVEKQEKFELQESKTIKKEQVQEYKDLISDIKEDYKYSIKNLDKDFKDEYRDLRKLRSLSGTTENEQLQEAYKKYLVDQLNKDINNVEKAIKKKEKEIKKNNDKLNKVYENTGNSSNSIGQSDENSTEFDSQN